MKIAIQESIQKLVIFLTHEDVIRLKQEKINAGQQDIHYIHMSDEEYAEILLHGLLNPERSKTEDEL